MLLLALHGHYGAEFCLKWQSFEYCRGLTCRLHEYSCVLYVHCGVDMYSLKKFHADISFTLVVVGNFQFQDGRWRLTLCWLVGLQFCIAFVVWQCILRQNCAIIAQFVSPLYATFDSQHGGCRHLGLMNLALMASIFILIVVRYLQIKFHEDTSVDFGVM